MSSVSLTLLLLIAVSLLESSRATLPSKYWVSSVRGKRKKWYANPNQYGCATGKYSDDGKPGYPYCPGDTIEVHSDFSLVAAQPRDNQGWTNHVSCMKCPATSYGSSSASFINGQVFRMVCDESVVGDLKELFSELLYGDNDFSLNPDGSFSTGTDGLYQRWMVGPDEEKMTWTTHSDVVCNGICDLRYTLVTPAAEFGSSMPESTWWTITNYYEVGEAVCDINLVSL